VYFYKEENFQEKWKKLVGDAPKASAEYLKDNWYNCKESWAYPFRMTARTYGNNTNNTVESFLRWLKATMHGSPPSISDFVGILYQFCCQKAQISSYSSFKNSTTRAVVQVPPEHKKNFEEHGKNLNEFAMRALQKQLVACQKVQYDYHCQEGNPERCHVNNNNDLIQTHSHNKWSKHENVCFRRFRNTQPHERIRTDASR